MQRPRTEDYVRYVYINYADRAEVAKIMSSAPLTFCSSRWNLSSSSTFFRRRKKSASMRGDWPKTGAYMSAVHVNKAKMANLRTRTYDNTGDVTGQVTEAGVCNILDKKLENRFEENVIPPGQCHTKSITVYKFLYQGKWSCRGDLLRNEIKLARVGETRKIVPF